MHERAAIVATLLLGGCFNPEADAPDSATTTAATSTGVSGSSTTAAQPTSGSTADPTTAGETSETTAVSTDDSSSGTTADVPEMSGIFELGPVKVADGAYAIAALRLDVDSIDDVALSSATLMNYFTVLGGDPPEMVIPHPSSNSIALAAADVDGDGLDDIVSAVIGAPTGSVNVYVDKGTGLAQIYAHSLPCASPTGIALGLINGDSKPDAVIGCSTTDQYVVVLGVGYANPPVTSHALTGPVSAVGLANVQKATPHLDLILVNTGGVAVLEGVGDGTFTPIAEHPVTMPHGLAIGHIDGDDLEDAIVAQLGTSQCAVFFNNGTGLTPPTMQECGMLPQVVYLRDLDGDGRDDRITLHTPGSVGTLRVARNMGDGSFAGADDYDAGDAPRAAAFGDFTGDGRTDIAVTSDLNGMIHFFTNTP